MIKIIESKAFKMVGDTSLFISFDFNYDIIEELKKIPPYHYDPKTHIWEMPVNSLSKIIDNLTNYDDIYIKCYEEETKSAGDAQLVVNYKTKPFQYQLEGIKYGLTNDKWMLLDCPGLGKTLQMVYLAEELKAQRGLQHCLIICAINTLKNNWKKEINKHSSLDCRIIGERKNKKGSIYYASVKERIAELNQPINEFFSIINIESIRNDDVVKAILHGPNKFDMIVVDEVHKAAGTRSQQSQNLLKIKSKYQIALTGTLLVNNPMSAFIPLTWLGFNKSVKTRFEEYFIVVDKQTFRTKYQNLDLLKSQIENHSLRRTKDLLELPPKTVIEELVDMSDEQRTFYDAIKAGVKEEANKIELNTTNLLALCTRLRQATACPSILTTEKIKSSKMDRACELVSDIVANDDKVVIFSTFKQTVNDLAALLSDYNPLVCTGDESDQLVSERIDMFQNDNEHKVMICTMSKMGTGVTLNRARYAIFIDMAWTAALQQQCEDRIHRIGSNQPVFIYRLICKDTFDERVLEIVRVKEALSSYIVDDEIDNSTTNYLKKFISEL